MRKYVIVIALVIAMYLNSILFNFIPLPGLRADMIMAVIVSLGILTGTAPAAALGVITGIFMDIMFNRFVGLSSLGYVFGAVAGGVFFNKFYADNFVIPPAAAAVAVFAKEHIMLFVSLAYKHNITNYGLLLLTHILPKALLTAGFCALIHLIFKKTLYRPLWHKDIDNRPG